MVGTSDMTIIGADDGSTVITSTGEGKIEPCGIGVQGDADLVIENVTFMGKGSNGIVTANDFTGTISIKGCKFINLNMGIYLNRGCTGGEITDCDFIGITHVAIGADALAGTLTLSGNDYGTKGDAKCDVEAYNGSEEYIVSQDGADILDADAPADVEG